MEANCCLTIFPLPAVDAVPVVERPEPANEIENLETAAREFNRSISLGHKSLSAAYWELGDTLLLLRPLYPHRTWEKHLSLLGIETTRAKRAIWLRENHTREEAEQVEAPAKAFAARTRKQEQRKKNAAEPARPEMNLATPVSTKSRKLAAKSNNVSDEEVLAFKSFVNTCGGLNRALAVVELCSSMFAEIAVHV